jgi:hypothetical protein
VTEFKGFRGPTRHTGRRKQSIVTGSEDSTMDAIRTPTRPSSRWPAVGILAAVATAVLACSFVATPAGAAVYKWVDPQGRIHYSDRPPPPEGKLLSVDTSYEHFRTGSERANVPAAVTRAAAPATQPSAAAPPGGASSEAQLKQTVANDIASTRTEQCKQAQDRYQNYVRSRRLYKEGPNKERVYLTDAELETERLNAKRDADDVCTAAAEQR